MAADILPTAPEVNCRTWSGPGWTATQSLLSVLVSIQSLLNEKPYHNEPGYDQVSFCVQSSLPPHTCSLPCQPHNPGDVEKYNDIIVHETLRVAVCEALTSSEGPLELQ